MRAPPLNARIVKAANNENLKLITDRLDRLEMQATQAAPRTFENANNKEDDPAQIWIPTHMIIGGWEPETDRETIDTECEHMMKNVAQVAPDCQRGYALRKYGSIAKIRVATGRLEHATENETMHINNIYMPRRTSKEWGDECLQALTPVQGNVCRDMDYTPSEDMVEMLWGERAGNLPKDFDGKQAPNVRDMLVAQNWPSSITTARPRTEREWTTRRDWNSMPEKVDYVMHSGIEMSRYDRLFVEGSRAITRHDRARQAGPEDRARARDSCETPRTSRRGGLDQPDPTGTVARTTISELVGSGSEGPSRRSIRIDTEGA